ncbi:MAG: hypothetical protein AB1Z98_05965 [Nannocystaceae bacterium]
MADLAEAPSPAVARRRAPRGRAPRARRVGMLGASMLAAVALASPGPAHAEGRRDDRPWSRGTLMPSFGIGAGGLFSDIANINFGLGFNYYIINGLSMGLSFSDTVLIYRSAIKARYPGIAEQLPTNIFDITPTLQYVFFRSRRFSPYVFGGVGPVFFNHGAGTYGQWTAGPGVFLNVAGPLFVNVGVGFSGLFPTGRCQDALTYQPSDPMTGGVLLDLCSFRWGPQLGLVVAFGGGRKGRRQRRQEQEERGYSPSPASNPMPSAVEPEPEPEPIEAAPVEPAVPAPAEPAAVRTTTEPDPDEGAAADVAPPPAAEPPAAEPPEELAPSPDAPPVTPAPPPVVGPSFAGEATMQ